MLATCMTLGTVHSPDMCPAPSMMRPATIAPLKIRLDPIMKKTSFLRMERAGMEVQVIRK